MKEKLGIVFIIVVALLCLFGCSSDKGLEEKDMVFQQELCPTSVQCENLAGIIGGHV